MAKDLLVVLKPGFKNNSLGSLDYYCPPCAQIEGFLGYYPAIRETIEILEIGFARPRAELVERLGEKFQDCPVLILADDAPVPAAFRGEVKNANGRRAIFGAGDITTYLGLRHGASLPH